MGQPGLFGLSDHLERLSEDGDPLEVLEATMDSEYFRGGWSRVLVMGMARRAAVIRSIRDRCSRL